MIVLIRLKDPPPSELREVFDLDTSDWKGTPEEKEIIDSGIDGNADWKLLGYWMGTSRTLAERNGRSGYPKNSKEIFLLFRQLTTSDTYWFWGIPPPPAFFDKELRVKHIPNDDVLKMTKFSFDVPSVSKLNEKYATLEAKIQKLRTQNDQQTNELRAQMLKLQAENEDQRRNYEDLQEQQYWKVIGIVCVSTGGLAFVFGVVFLGIRCKWRGSTTTTDEEQYIPNDEQIYAGDVVIPGKLENNRPPILVDECEKFGLHEIYDVTAGEGGDLVRIARPLETAGGARKLSEELLNIQPIYQDEEGRVPSKLHGTSPGGTKGGDVLDHEQSGNGVLDGMRK